MTHEQALEMLRRHKLVAILRGIPLEAGTEVAKALYEGGVRVLEFTFVPDLKRLSKQTTQSIMRQYVQNLYRFFKLFPNAKEFDNPFEHLSLCPRRINPLYNSIVEADSLLKIISLNIKQKNYLRAIEFFIRLEEYHPDRMEATQLQQLGLCYQKKKMYDAAIEAYTKADLIQPDSYWTIYHLAQCYRAVNRYDRALEYYETAESMKPDNLSLTFHVAEMQYEEGEYEEALPRLHKIDYHHPEALKSVRLLAECNFLIGKPEQAARYYERMMTEHADELTATDWRHAAYNYWLWGKRDDCFRCMSRAEELQPMEPYDDEMYASAPKFADVIYADGRMLHALGARKEDLPYLYDAYYRSKRRKH